jgi:hypothetical protein
MRLQPWATEEMTTPEATDPAADLTAVESALHKTAGPGRTLNSAPIPGIEPAVCRDGGSRRCHDALRSVPAS